jgi:hypothetical protein
LLAIAKPFWVGHSLSLKTSQEANPAKAITSRAGLLILGSLRRVLINHPTRRQVA